MQSSQITRQLASLVYEAERKTNQPDLEQEEKMKLPTMIRSLILLLLTVFVASELQNKETLYFLVLAPFEGGRDPSPAFSRGHSLIPAVQLAVEHINNSTHILPNHTLDIIVGDSACDYGTETALPFVEHVTAGNKQVLGIVGPACTEASLFLANLTQRNRYGIVQAMMATSNIFEDHQRYRHTFGMVSSFNALVDAFLKLAKRENWTKIGVFIDQSREFFVQTFRSLQERSKNTTISIQGTWGISAPFYIDRPLDDLKSNRTTRVIFGIMSAETARHVVCLAGIKGITYPQYQFVFADRSLSSFIVSNFTSNGYECNKEIMLKGLNGSIMLRYSLDSMPSETFLNDTAKITIGEMRNQYKQKLKEYAVEQKLDEDLAVSSYAYPYYDSTWALAMSVHEAIQEVDTFGPSNTLFVNNSDRAELIRQKFEELSFQGVSVRVEINSMTGHVANVVNKYQVNDTEEITENISYIQDGYKNVYTHIHYALAAFFLLVILAAFIVTLLLQVLNIHYSDYFTIKASSPRLNHFIYFSCYVILITMLFNTLFYGFLTDVSSPETRQVAVVFCNINAFLYPFPLSVIISTVLVKLWRLYSIFNRSFKKQVLVFDKHLAVIIVAFQLCVIVLAIPWVSIKEAHLTITSGDVYINEVENIKAIETSCTADSWLTSLPFMFILLLTVFSFWLAYLNRKIRQNEYRSKETIIFTYLFCIMLGVDGISLLLTFLLEFSQQVEFLVLTIESLGVVVLCITVLFFPPIYPILKGKFVTHKHSFISARLKKLHDLS